MLHRLRLVGSARLHAVRVLRRTPRGVVHLNPRRPLVITLHSRRRDALQVKGCRTDEASH